MKPVARLLLPAFLLLANPLPAQVNVSENFDSMGTGTATPAGWSFYGWSTGNNNTWAYIHSRGHCRRRQSQHGADRPHSSHHPEKRHHRIQPRPNRIDLGSRSRNLSHHIPGRRAAMGGHQHRNGRHHLRDGSATTSGDSPRRVHPTNFPATGFSTVSMAAPPGPTSPRSIQPSAAPAEWSWKTAAGVTTVRPPSSL